MCNSPLFTDFLGNFAFSLTNQIPWPFKFSLPFTGTLHESNWQLSAATRYFSPLTVPLVIHSAAHRCCVSLFLTSGTSPVSPVCQDEVTACQIHADANPAGPAGLTLPTSICHNINHHLCAVTVTESFALCPTTEARGHIAKQSPIFPVSAGMLLQKYSALVFIVRPLLFIMLCSNTHVFQFNKYLF